ncbi:MAG: diguanylate cyclase [Proteobacteria bacterium]|uniref:diguanylate cyclase domain-containing protein n=1 Tax=Aquabacterium sp. TaxID=1872578 RepID=UPI0035C6A13C|nr:diguanylate cyclase [Pseudomonadota bacterium]
MEGGQSRTSQFTVYLYAMLGIVGLLVVSFVLLVFEQRRYEQALDSRAVSVRYAEELRQSSNDLTRLMRTYVITGNRTYKAQFEAVVDIRDGKRPRPANYSLAYWDFKAIQPVGAPEAEPVGEAVPLLELMRRAGLTDAELGQLRQSKAKSDELVRIEQKAMAMVEEGPAPPPLLRLEALGLLSDEHFLTLKSDVMRPIVEMEQMVLARTELAVASAHRRLSLAIGSLFVLGALLVLLILKVRQQLRLIIGCSIVELQKTLATLGSGDFLKPIAVDARNADSVLGWVAQTQRRLAETDLAHFKAIVESSDDAIISKTMDGIVASWNRGAEKAFGYSAQEMIGRPMQTIIPTDRLHEEADILASVARGARVDHFPTQRQHRDGRLVDVSVTISPIYNHKGEVIGASKIARDISKAKAAEAEIHRLAFHDALTGLPNRRLFLDRLKHTLARASRDRGAFAVLFLDLDNFKSLNDTHGHDAGDELLQEAAKRLSECVRASDTVARLGGDEFVMILCAPVAGDASDLAWVRLVAQKVIASLARPYQMGAIRHTCTTSIGASAYTGQPCTAGDLMKQADQAMYEAKSAGKNAFRFHACCERTPEN